MSNAAPTHFDQSSFTTEEHVLAQEFLDRARMLEQGSGLAQLMQQVVSALDRGVSVDVIHHDAEVSPNRAAEMLKMSRPHLLSFMDKGDLPFHRVGTHRKIKMRDLMDFMRARDEGRKIAAAAIYTAASTWIDESELSQSEKDQLDNL